MKTPMNFEPLKLDPSFPFSAITTENLPTWFDANKSGQLVTAVRPMYVGIVYI